MKRRMMKVKWKGNSLSNDNNLNEKCNEENLYSILLKEERQWENCGSSDEEKAEEIRRARKEEKWEWRQWNGRDEENDEGEWRWRWSDLTSNWRYGGEREEERMEKRNEGEVEEWWWRGRCMRLTWLVLLAEDLKAGEGWGVCVLRGRNAIERRLCLCSEKSENQ